MKLPPANCSASSLLVQFASLWPVEKFSFQISRQNENSFQISRQKFKFYSNFPQNEKSFQISRRKIISNFPPKIHFKFPAKMKTYYQISRQNQNSFQICRQNENSFQICRQKFKFYSNETNTHRARSDRPLRSTGWCTTWPCWAHDSGGIPLINFRPQNRNFSLEFGAKFGRYDQPADRWRCPPHHKFPFKIREKIFSLWNVNDTALWLSGRDDHDR